MSHWLRAPKAARSGAGQYQSPRVSFSLSADLLLPAAEFRRPTRLLDISGIRAYYHDIAPDIWRLYPGNIGTAKDRSFLVEAGAGAALWPSKGQEPAGANFSHRDLSRRTGYPYVKFFTD
jgi:hypothetical protein